MKHFIHLNKEKKREFRFDKPGSYLVFFENLSGRFVFDLAAANVSVEIYGVFCPRGDTQHDIQTIQLHSAPNTTSSLLIKGVFVDETKFHYKGLIRIEKEGQKSHAYQKNQNLVLSHNVFVNSEPDLEILANDVFCTHGSTTGKINKDELYYLESRGLGKKQSQDIIVAGFIGEVYDKVKDKVPNALLEKI